jgi:hypothetical protein
MRGARQRRRFRVRRSSATSPTKTAASDSTGRRNEPWA